METVKTSKMLACFQSRKSYNPTSISTHL